MDTVVVGNPGNAGELSGEAAGGEGPTAIVGGVDYIYRIGKFEVTAGQYTEFLNAVAYDDTYGLYDTRMDTDSFGCNIQRTGGPGSYSYYVSPTWADRPVNYVTWLDAARFANWLHNDQLTGPQDATTTEDGSYTLNGYTGSDGAWILRNPEATWVLPGEHEWYKAAYHLNDGITGNYWDYPTASDIISTLDANYDFVVGHTSPVGAYNHAPSAYGTFDQGGNVWEWCESIIADPRRSVRGGSFGSDPFHLNAAFRSNLDLPSASYNGVGFRVALVPEPTTLIFVALGTPLLTRRRR
jgi:formylglycine-generating enzyme required for sulfatase activity